MSKVKLTTWNATGIWNSKEKVYKLMDDNQADIVCIQETKTTAEQACRIKLPAYHAFAAEQKEQLNQSGVAIFSKEKPLKFFEAPEEITKQGRVLAAEFNSFVLINVYLSMAGRNKENLKDKYTNFYDLMKLVNKVKHAKKPAVIVGDFNVSEYFVDHEARAWARRYNAGCIAEEYDLFRRLKTQFDIKFTDVFKHMYTQESLVEYIDGKYGDSTFSQQGLRQDYILVSDDILPNVVSADIHFYTAPNKDGISHTYQSKTGWNHVPFEVVLEF